MENRNDRRRAVLCALLFAAFCLIYLLSAAFGFAIQTLPMTAQSAIAFVIVLPLFLALFFAGRAVAKARPRLGKALRYAAIALFALGVLQLILAAIGI